MMQHEFEELAGYKVDNDVYKNVIEPMYLATDISKFEFVKMLNKKAFEVKEVKEPNIKKMCVRDRSGFSKTPNRCYFYIQYVELIDVDIRTGKFIVAPLDDEELRKLSDAGKNIDLGYDYDFDYTQCVDRKKQPICLSWQ